MIEVVNEDDYPVDEARLQTAAQVVLERHNVESDVSIAISTNEGVAALNRQFRGIDAPTDVLSFPMEGLPGYLGDMIIAYPYASAQAAREGHALSDSLALLVVHGTLHLLGYDHDTQEHRATMWAAQEAALIALGIPPEIVPALEQGVHDEPQG